MLSLLTAGLWYSTWCLTASHTVSAHDAFVPVAGFWFFITHTDHNCAPLSRTPHWENCQIWSGERSKLPPAVRLCTSQWQIFVGGGCSRSTQIFRVSAGVVPKFHSPPKKTVSLWVRRIFSATCHATDPNYSPSTYPPSLSGSFVLPAPFPETQLNSTNPVRRKAFSNPLCPSSPSVVSLLLPRILLSSCTVSSFCFNERKRSAGQTPGV